MADDTNQPLFGQLPAVSPSSLALRRAQALKMMEAGNDYSPILSKWQGAARLAQGIMGNVQLGMEERSESEARKKQVTDVMEAMNSGDRAKLLAAALNPFTPEAISRVAAEKAFPTQQTNNAYNYPVNPTTGAAMPGAVPRVPEGGISAGPVSVPGYGAPAGTPPPGGAGPIPAPTPRPSSAPSAPGPALPPNIKELGKTGADVSAMMDEAKQKIAILSKMKEEGIASHQRLDEMAQVANLAQKARYGPSAELANWAANKGISTPNASVEQLYTDLIKFYGPQLRPEGSGGMRGPELSGFYGSLGGLMRKPEGREAAISFINRAHQWKAQAGDIASDASLDSDARLSRINGLKLPNIDLSKLARPEMSREQAIEEAKRRGLSGF